MPRVTRSTFVDRKLSRYTEKTDEEEPTRLVILF